MKKIIFALAFVFTSFLSASLANYLGPGEPNHTLAVEGTKIGLQYQLKLISIERAPIARGNADNFAWGLLFTSLEKLELKDCQIMVHDLLVKLTDVALQNPAFDKYFQDMNKVYRRPLQPISEKNIAFRINFWDENVDRRLYPYIAEVRVVEGIFYYYYADPVTQGLQPATLVEPFSKPSL